jgi:hypothetical protein
MARSSTWTGWISFAGWLMVIIGMIDFFEGLIAIIRGSYYAVTPNQIVVVNLTTWGWVTLLWGIVLVIAGLALLSGQTWARWFTIVVASIGFILQLGFVGSSAYPLWSLSMLALTLVVLYALIVRWNDGRPEATMT